MKPFFAGLAVGVLVAIGGGAALVLRGGLSARPEPSRVEAAVARKLRAWSIPSFARNVANPLPSGDTVIVQGRAHFADHCATCHDNDGSGRTEVGRKLYPRPPDLRAAATQELSDGELFWIIENGIRFTGMPGWGVPGEPEESWQLVHFIRHLPHLTEAERLEMERLNPRSPAEWREMEEEEEFLRGGEQRRHQAGEHHH